MVDRQRFHVAPYGAVLGSALGGNARAGHVAMVAASAPAPSPARAARISAVDWARGIAVLLMIQAHTFDAWTHASAKTSTAFGYFNILGGMAAPGFLFLAGASVVLSMERKAATGATRWQQVRPAVCRGLEIFILAFVFRLQSFLVTPGKTLLGLFRVDILNVLGPAVALTALVWGVGRGNAMRMTLLSVAATCVALATPLVRVATWVGSLPVWFQWYLRPAGEHTTFTALPWVGFVFAGGAIGVLVAVAARSESVWTGRVRWAALLLGGAAAARIGLLTATWPSPFPGSAFWTTSPSFFLIRLGALTGTLAAAGLVEQLWPRSQSWLAALARLGRHSLFIYWVHVELVYGYASWPLRKTLSLPIAGLAYVIFCFAMYASLDVRDRLVHAWRTGRLPGAPAQAAPA